MYIETIVNQAISLGAIQKPDEFFYLLHSLASEPPEVVVEIGTAKGGSLYAFCQVAKDDALIVSIDLPGGPFGGVLDNSTLGFETFSKPKQTLHLLSKDSHEKDTLERLEEILDGRKIDFLMIDGDHTYSGVKQDWEMYSPLVRPNGLIALHDICFHKTMTSCQVDRFWLEIKDKYEHHSLIDGNDSTWGGIGLIRYGKKHSENHSGIMLDIGFSDSVQKGFIGMRRTEGADIVHDLEVFPWPIEDNSVHICVGHHVAEHIKPWLIFNFFDEAWRVIKRQGQLALSMPYAGSTAYWADPTHCTGFNEKSFFYLDPRYEAYKTYKPKPWEIEKGYPIWQVTGNLEILLRPLKVL
jgi:hypothetical protein